MSWIEEWHALSAALDSWLAAAESFMQGYQWLASQLDSTAYVLVGEAHRLRDCILRMNMPDGLYTAVNDMASGRLRAIWNTTDGPQGVVCQIVFLRTLRTRIDEAARRTEEPRRSIVERAFLHLDRLLVLDEDTRSKWLAALDKGETTCEKLGALHLLSHGVYAFKIDAQTGITDLVFNEPVVAAHGFRSASVLVLTEWKLVRVGDDPAEAARVGLRQAKRYAGNELGGSELSESRYIVLVSRRPVPVPAVDEIGNVTYRFLNVVVERKSPSSEARDR